MSDLRVREGGATGIRGAFGKLFPTGWRSVVQWAVVGYASAWFWLEAFESGALGPVAWGINLLDALGMDVPSWIADIPAVLVDEDAAALSWVLPLTATVLATSMVRARRPAVLLAFAEIALLVAIERAGTFTPVLIVVLTASIPAAVALSMGAYQTLRRSERASTEFSAVRVVSDYVVVTLSVIWLPVVLPILGAIALVLAYGRNRVSRTRTQASVSAAAPNETANRAHQIETLRSVSRSAVSGIG